MRRSATCLALVVVVLLAGCSGFTGQSTTTEPTQSTPTPTAQQSTTPSTANVSFPSGVSSSGVTDADALLEQHNAALNQTTYTTTFSSGSGQQQLVTGYEAGENATRVFYEITEQNQTTTRDVWIQPGEKVVAVRKMTSKGVQYRYRAGDLLEAKQYHLTQTLVEKQFVGPALKNGDYQFQGTVTKNGSRLLKFTASEPASDVENPPEKFRGTLLVTPDGIIHSFTAETKNDGSVVGFTYATKKIGETTASKPKWMKEFPEVSVERTSDGPGITLNVAASSKDIPKQSRVLVQGGDKAAVTKLVQPINAGSTAYLAVESLNGTDGKYSLSVRDSPPKTATVMSEKTQVVILMNGMRMRYILPATNETTTG